MNPNDVTREFSVKELAAVRKRCELPENDARRLVTALERKVEYWQRVAFLSLAAWLSAIVAANVVIYICG